jgi:2-iminobutanoate/2-iminopropanoate deaminase
MKRIIKTENAPAVVGAYSQAVEIKGVLYVSGQIGLDPATGKLVDGGVNDQAQRVMNNISAILKSAGYEFSDVVKSTILLKNIEDFKTVNDIYAECYPENQPARAAYAVKDLPLGALVEVETIAVK